MQSFLSPKQVCSAILVGLFAIIVSISGARGAVPEISHIQDVFIVGENFDGEGIQVRTWQPPQEDFTKEQLAAVLAGNLEVPAEPPQGSSPVNILSAEPQVLTTNMRNGWEHFSMQYIWVGNDEGWSEPCVIGRARPFWVSETRPEPGQALHLFGYDINQRFGNPAAIVLRGETGELLEMEMRWDPSGAGWDPHLLFTRVPAEAPPGRYEVFVHNGSGGLHGWASAGEIEVVESAPEPEVFAAVEHGAVGNGRTDDTKALQDLIDRAHEAGGGVVFLDPGVYLVSRTVVLRPGVELRGADASKSIIRGAGYNRHGERFMWFSSDPVPASVLVFQDRTVIDSVTLTGAVSEGVGGRALIQGLPGEITFPDGGRVDRVTIRNCILLASGVDDASGNRLYGHGGGTAIDFTSDSYRFSLVDNEIHGSLTFGTHRMAERAEIRRNVIHGGGLGGHMVDSFVDSNILKDAPARALLYGRRHTYSRYNEMHLYSYDSWRNRPEPFLVHGGEHKLVSSPTAVGERQLTDARQQWVPGEHRDQYVLITAGRGFGQYRRVLDNSGDRLEIDEPWRVQPDESSEYTLGAFFVESAMYANLNNSVGVTSLWLDCISLRVIRQRDFNATGITIWGGHTIHGPANPSWYNTLANNWLDGADVSLMNFDKEGGIYRGPSMFANVVSGNQIRNSHASRQAHGHINPLQLGAISVGGGSSHTRIANNFIASNPVGIYVMAQSNSKTPVPAHRTIIENNVFQAVDEPLLDGGAGTIFVGNKDAVLTAQGTVETELPDVVEEAEPMVRARTEPLPRGRAGEWVRPVNHIPARSQPFVSFLSARRAEVRSDEVREADQENLRALYGVLREFEQKEGALPEAVIFPQQPLEDEDSLAVILGEAAAPYRVSPASGPELEELGWLTYIWNEELNGKRFEDVKNPAETWVLMDLIAIHPFMVRHHHGGYQGGVNVLYADGSVRWVPADDIPLKQ